MYLHFISICSHFRVAFSMNVFNVWISLGHLHQFTLTHFVFPFGLIVFINIIFNYSLDCPYQQFVGYYFLRFCVFVM